MGLHAGARLGPYEIAAPLGAGGMGEVYKARDTRLDRTVAIKVLPEPFAGNLELKQRLEREARAISSLNHPHICTLYDVGQQDGADFLVMEYLEGESLAQRLNKGPLPINEAITYAIQIADALDKAHRQGLVHRDLKPGNIMLVKSGAQISAKLLDFGLAKAMPQVAMSAAAGATISQHAAAPLTAQGSVAGTFQYMAPEQFEGKEADARSDVFAFGVVLYEMVTGRKAFEGKTQASLIVKIMEHEPAPISTVQPVTPPALERLVRHCLAKDPQERWQTAHDLLLQLRWIGEGGSQVGVAPVLARRRKLRAEFAWAAAGVSTAALLAILGVGAWTWLQPKPVPQQTRFTIAPPENSAYTLGTGGPLTLSPDGRRLAFVTGTFGKGQLWVRDLDSLTPRLLPGTEGAWHPTWSPDGRFLAFVIPGAQYKKIDVNGGTPITIADPGFTGLLSSAWSREGAILFTGAGARLFRIPESGGQPVAVTELDKSRNETSHTWPIFLPDGRRFIYAAQGSDTSKSALYLASLDSPARTHLIDGFSFVAYARGYLFFQRRGTLMAQPFDEKAGRVNGDGAPVIEGVQSDESFGDCACSVSADGTLAYITGTSLVGGNALTWFDAHGQRAGTVGEPSVLQGFRISPDGRSLAVSLKDNSTNSNNSANYDIWTIDLERNVSTRLTSDSKIDNNPIWSADGTHVIFRSDRKGQGDLYQRAAGGGGADELLFESLESKAPTSASRDGKLMLFTRNMGGQKKTDIWALPLSGDRKPFPVVSTDFNESGAAFSPDGRWIAYDSSESGANQIYIQPFPPTGPRVRVSTTTGNNPAWSADGRQLFYRTNDNHVMSVDVTSPMRPGVPKELFTQAGGWTMDPVHQRFLMAVAPDATGAAPITVVLNWTAGLGKK
jgi:Tol biopolymer transport system component